MFFLHKLKLPIWKSKRHEHVLLFWGYVFALLEVEQSEPGLSSIEFLSTFWNEFFEPCRYVHQSYPRILIAHVTFSVCLLIGEGHSLHILGFSMDGEKPTPGFMEVILWQLRSSCLFFLWVAWPHQGYSSAHWVCKSFWYPWILYMELVICDGS